MSVKDMRVKLANFMNQAQHRARIERTAFGDIDQRRAQRLSPLAQIKVGICRGTKID
jgi:hypothetical protein